MNEFAEKKYKVIRRAIPRTLADFIYQYFYNKRKVARLMFDIGYIPPSNSDWGIWTDPAVPNTYSHYGDLVMETLLKKIQPLMEKEARYKLNPSYAYARLYKKGDNLERHKDRSSCEISATLNLGGDPWALFLDPTGKGKMTDNGYEIGNAEGDAIIQQPGDMLMYYGCELEHWRETFKGENHAQVFLHFNDARKSTINKYDYRPFLGLPVWFRGMKRK